MFSHVFQLLIFYYQLGLTVTAKVAKVFPLQEQVRPDQLWPYLAICQPMPRSESQDICDHPLYFGERSILLPREGKVSRTCSARKIWSDL